jgi:hypothetical protein
LAKTGRYTARDKAKVALGTYDIGLGTNYDLVRGPQGGKSIKYSRDAAFGVEYVPYQSHGEPFTQGEKALESALWYRFQLR